MLSKMIESFSENSDQRYTGFNSKKTEGPLNELYSNPYNFSNMFYPRNLGSEQRGHYINFYINVAQNSTYIKDNVYNINDSQFSVFEQAGRTASNQESVQASNVVSGAVSELKKLVTTRKTKRISQAIALYMPETVNVQYNADWQSQSLTDAGGRAAFFGQAAASLSDSFSSGEGFLNTVKNLASDPSALEVIGGKMNQGALGFGAGAQDFLLYAFGTALNPQLEVLFKGVDFRTFQFDFLFSPYDSQESSNILNIVKTFRFHMAPEIQTGAAGRYFTPPSEFDIDFIFNGQVNEKVHQIGTCVLTNVNVDYAPNGWSTFDDGMPTQIRMTLQFMETEIVTKQRVDEDNY